MKDKTETIYTQEQLAEAIKIVKAAIKARESEYLRIASTEEQDPIMIEGETESGYACHIMADPKDAAHIFLEYDYPIWDILEEEAPSAMWDRLAKLYGLSTVYSVDL